MKKQILFFMAMQLLARAATAQYTATAAACSPVAGDVFQYHFIDSTGGFTKGAAGAGVTWNFPSFQVLLSTDLHFVTCASTLYCDSFPGSNLASYAGPTTDSTWTYYKSNTSAMSNLGYTGPSYIYRFSNPAEYRYPITYNTKYVDTVIYSGGGYSDVYIDSFHCDAYGTLVLSTGTYTNVGRMRQVEIKRSYFGATAYDSSRREIYMWGKAGYHAPLLVLNYDSLGSGALHLSTFGSFYSTGSASFVNNSSQNATHATIYPNPTTGLLTIFGAENVTIKVYNTIGQLLKEADNANNISISEFPAGIFFIRLIDNKGRIIHQDKIVKE